MYDPRGKTDPAEVAEHEEQHEKSFMGRNVFR
jgi:hypothetical protein